MHNAELTWKSFAFLQYLNGAYRLPLFYMAIYITVRGVLAAGDYASEVCVPLALRYIMERILFRQSLSPTTA